MSNRPWKRREKALLAAPAIALLFVYLVSGYNSRKVRLNWVQKRAQEIAGRGAINCGHNPEPQPQVKNGQSNRLLDEQLLLRDLALMSKVDACAVGAYRNHKAFTASYDFRHNFNDLKREIVVGDSSGILHFLTFYKDGTGKDRMDVDASGVLEEKVCASPIIARRGGLQSPEYLRCK